MTESRDPEAMRERAVAALNAKTWDLSNNSQVGAEGHAIVCALLYVGDLLNGIGYLLANPVKPAPVKPPKYTLAVDHLADIAHRATPPRRQAKHRVLRPEVIADLLVLRPEVIADLLSLINITVTSAEVSAWDVRMREQAADYAAAVHLHASDNPDVAVPPRPAFLPAERAPGQQPPTRDQ